MNDIDGMGRGLMHLQGFSDCRNPMFPHAPKIFPVRTKCSNTIKRGDEMRGGYRVGSGPRKGAKYKTRSLKNVPESEVTPEQKENIRLMLSFGQRIMDGGKLTRAEMKQLREFQF